MLMEMVGSVSSGKSQSMTSHADFVPVQLPAASSPWFADDISSVGDMVSVFCAHKLAYWPDLKQLQLLQNTFVHFFFKGDSWRVNISCYIVWLPFFKFLHNKKEGRTYTKIHF